MTLADSPLVSVLIPCHNGESFVGEAIDSALSQTHRAIEVVVIDDGSTDATPDVLASYAGSIRHRRIPRSGACTARNAALAMAHGEFIQFLDADDLLMPDKIERQLPRLVADQADLVFCRGTLFGDGKPERPKKEPVLSLEGKDPFCYVITQGLSTPAPLHRRTLLDLVGGFRPGVPCGQEWDLHVRLAATGARLAFLDEPLVRIRHHNSPDRLTRTPRPADAFLKVLLGLERELGKGTLYKLSAGRKAALAACIGQHAAYAFRNGARDCAREAFGVAARLDPGFSVETERGWYRASARAVGHWKTECLLDLIRSLRNRLRHATALSL